MIFFAARYAVQSMGSISKKMMKKMPDHLEDVFKLSASLLQKKYPSEYSSWKNMKRRCTTAPEEHSHSEHFTTFQGFLAMMGPKPDASFTIDRIDCMDVEYAPDKCRWADKQTQSENRRTTVFITHAGTCRSIAGWAAVTNQSPQTLRSRRDKGWSSSEIVCGRGTGDQTTAMVSGNRSSSAQRRRSSNSSPLTAKAISTLKRHLEKTERWDSRYVASTWSEGRATCEQAKRELVRLDQEYSSLRELLFHIALSEDLGGKIDRDTQEAFDRYKKSYPELVREAGRLRQNRQLVRKNLLTIARASDNKELLEFLEPQDQSTE
ncbi:MAG: hypothetical protein ABJN52_17080 [Litorimonas sp.]